MDIKTSFYFWIGDLALSSSKLFCFYHILTSIKPFHWICTLFKSILLFLSTRWVYALPPSPTVIAICTSRLGIKAGCHSITKARHWNTKTYDSQSFSFITFHIEDDHKSVARLSRISAKWTLNEPPRRPSSHTTILSKDCYRPRSLL